MLFLKIILGVLAVYSIGYAGALWSFRKSDSPVRDAAVWPLWLLFIIMGLMGWIKE